jgi:hypothetical protein
MSSLLEHTSVNLLTIAKFFSRSRSCQHSKKLITSLFIERAVQMTICMKQPSLGCRALCPQCKFFLGAVATELHIPCDSTIS